MIVLGVEMDAGAVHHNLIGLRASLDEELTRAFREVGEVVASAARADHPYRDQTDTLTKRTRAYAPRGRFLGDSLAVEVIANTPYATNVADHYREDWLERALTAQDGRVEHELERALAHAVATSNFG